MKRTSQSETAIRAIRAIDHMSRKYLSRMFITPTVVPSRRDGWLG